METWERRTALTAFGGGFSDAKPYPYVVAIIQARMGGTRFPGKVMADLNGKPVLWHVIERVKRATRVHQVVVASPDLELVEYANYHQAWGFHFPQEPENV